MTGQHTSATTAEKIPRLHAVGYLDISPIPPPPPIPQPIEEPVDFFDIARAAGMKFVVSIHSPPDVRICAGA